MENQTVISAPWRATGAGGLTIPLAFRTRQDRIEYTRTYAKEYSRSGTHGVWYFRDVDIIILLEQSNMTLHRYVRLHFCGTSRQVCEEILQMVHNVWVKQRRDTIDVVREVLHKSGI